MQLVVVPQLAAAAVAAIVGGLALLIRGFAGYRATARITGIGTSTISSLAVGEVRVSGVVEPAEVTLVSPLQSERCVYYRSSIRESSRDDAAVFDEERAIGFRVRDASGTVRVFPRGASFDVPVRFAESTGAFGEQPAGLLIRAGGDTTVGEPSREAQIAALLTVHPAAAMPGSATGEGAGWNFGGGFGQPGRDGGTPIQRGADRARRRRDGRRPGAAVRPARRCRERRHGRFGRRSARRMG